MTKLSWEPIYGSPLVAILAAMIVVSVIALVTPPTNDPKKRRWLVLLRSIAGLVLLVAAMRPAIIHTKERPAPATLVIAADVSRSMTLPDGAANDRWSTQNDVVQQLAKGLAGLADSMDVSLMAYSDKGELLSQAVDAKAVVSLGQTMENQKPNGDVTDLSAALRASVDIAAGKPIAGIILIGDGTQTAIANNSGGQTQGANSTGNAQASAETLQSLGVPLWTVPIGPPGSDDAARDVAITGLTDSLQLFAGNQFDLGFTVEAQGLARTRIPITMTWIKPDDSEEEALARQIDIPDARSTVAMNVAMQAPEPGVYRLQVRAPAQTGEWVTSNNSQSVFVEVLEGGGRILIIQGSGRPEQTFLRRSLGEFPDLEVDSISVRSQSKGTLDLNNALQPGRYDIFILGDIHSSSIGDEQLSKLAQRVAQGAGLVTLGGFQTYGSGGYAGGPLDGVLPIEMDASRAMPPVRGVLTRAERQARQSSQLPGPIRFQVERDHPIVQLGSQGSEAVWQALPTMTGANRFVGNRVATGIQVLLKTTNGQPLLVVGGFGQGRVASLAFDETHRWWRGGQSDAHRRFWRQLMLWLMSREETSGDRVIAELDRRRFETNAQPGFRAKLQMLGRNNGNIQLTAELIDENGQRTPLKTTVSDDDSIAINGVLPELEPGFYRLSVSANNETIEPDQLAFQVTSTSREFARPMADPVYLQQLAEMTSSNGGGSFAPDDIAALIERVKSKRRSAQTPVVRKDRLGDGPISGWIVFVIFAGALSIEWFLRRRWSMV